MGDIVDVEVTPPTIIDVQVGTDTGLSLVNLPTAGEKAALEGSFGTPSGLNVYMTETDPLIAQISLNTTHRSSDGSDHTFINQDLTIGSAPSFLGTSFTQIPFTGLSAQS